MAKATGRQTFDSLTILQVLVGILFLLLGIYGIIPTIQESVFTLWDANRTLEVLFGVAELVCSVVLLAGVFMSARRNQLRVASIVIMVFWAARIVLSKIVLGISAHNSRLVFAGGLAHWAMVLVVELIILVGIINVVRKYR